MILLFVLDFVLGMLSPVVGVVDLLWPGSSPPAILIELSTLASLIGLFLLVGFVADRTSGSSIAPAFHSRMEAVPVIGSLYMSVRQASDVMIPLGPNPTSNGFVMHFPTDRVHDVDLTVEDAIHAIATLGVASDPDE